MCEAGRNARVWLDPVIPKIAANLGISDVQYELSIPADSFYLSNTFYINIQANKAGKSTRISLVVKRPSEDEQTRLMIQSDSQFHNEILFYRSYANGSEDFPHCVYADLKPPTDTILVLENVAERGYLPCSSKYDVPLEYTLAAMQEIGRFHARGYIMKERRREKFFELVRDTLETRYFRFPGYKFQVFVDLIASRAIDYLRRQNYEKTFCDKMDTFFSNAYENILMKVVEPAEPLSTLCHGDFTLNNVLFNKKNDVVKAMLIDFATIRYGLPVIDLSTYLCLSHVKNLQRETFERILRTYRESVVEHLLNNDVKDTERYSYEAFYEDFKRGALLGFIIASFFLGTMMGTVPPPSKDYFDMEITAAAKVMRESGGDELSKILADMLLNLKDLGCLEHVL